YQQQCAGRLADLQLSPAVVGFAAEHQDDGVVIGGRGARRLRQAWPGEDATGYRCATIMFGDIAGRHASTGPVSTAPPGKLDEIIAVGRVSQCGSLDDLMQLFP